MRKRYLVLAAATVSVASFGITRQAMADSYASGLKVSGTTVTFDLNESTQSLSAINSGNGDVTLLYNGITQDLGALPAGLQSITLSATPTTPVQVAVTTHDNNGYLASNTVQDNTILGSVALEIDPENPGNTTPATAVLFGSPRGDAVDTNPADATFGMVYATNNATHGGNLPQQGVYALNADLSFVGTPAGGFAGTNEAVGPVDATANAGKTAGLTFSGAGPTTVQVGSDGNLYIGNGINTSTDSVANNATDSIYSAQLSTTTGLVSGTGKNVLTGIGIAAVSTVANADAVNNTVPTLNANENHADPVSNVFITGSSAAGNLNVYAIDDSFGSAGATTASQLDFDGFYDWQVGNDAPATNGTGADVAPTQLNHASAFGLDTRFWNPQPTTDWMFSTFQGVIDDLTRGGPANQFYMTQSRSAGSQPDLFIYSPIDNSTVVWTSLDQTERQGLSTNADFLLGAFDDTVSPDGRFLAIGQASSAGVYFGAYIMPLLAGIPDVRLSQPFNLNIGGTQVGPAENNYIRGIAFDAADNVYATNSGNANIAMYGPGGNSVTVTGSNGTFTNSAQWTGSGGNISSTSNWLAGSLPNGTDQALTFGTKSTAISVNVDSNVTEGAITFSSANGYTLAASGGSISLSGLGANITATAGSNTIAAPITINTDIGLYAAAGASVTISGHITYANVTEWSSTATPDVVKAGPGTVSVSNLNLVQSNLGDASSANLDIYAGKLQLLPNSGVAAVSELSVITGQGASLDLTNNDLIYDYNLNTYVTTSPVAVVEQLVATGGIFTSVGGVKAGTGLAVVENNSTYLGANTFGSFDGQAINAESSTGGTVLVKYTYFGDLNLDGKVDGTDFALMGSGLTGWGGGDLNYATDASGNYDVVNADDWSLFQLGAAEYGAGHVQLPEPASVALLGLATIPMIRRRRA